MATCNYQAIRPEDASILHGDIIQIMHQKGGRAYIWNEANCQEGWVSNYMLEPIIDQTGDIQKAIEERRNWYKTMDGHALADRQSTNQTTLLENFPHLSKFTGIVNMRQRSTAIWAPSPIHVNTPLPQFKPEFVKQLKDITCSRGNDVTMQCEVCSNGPCSVFVWTGPALDHDYPVNITQRVKIESCGKDNGSSFSISDVRVTDSGQYVCTATNDIGRTKTFMWLKVIGQPGEPGKPDVFVKENHVNLSWSPSGIFGNTDRVWYCVLYRTKKKRGYRVAVESVSATHVTIDDLTPGRHYQFQIKAFNEAGSSLASSPSDIIKVPLLDMNYTEESSNDSCQEQEAVSQKESILWLPHFYHNFEVDTEPLGRGRFSLVKKAQCIRTDNVYAVKCCSKYEEINMKVRLEREMQLMNRLRHPHIAKVFNLYDTEHDLFMLMQYICGPPVLDFVTHLGYYTEQMLQATLTHILDALQYIHALNITHLDIKAENLLVNPKKDPFEVVLIDFGDARVENTTQSDDTVLPEGSLEYVAPEQLRGVGLCKSDIWATGVFLYVFLSGISPFVEETDEETQNNIMNGNYFFPDDVFGEVPSLAVNLVADMLNIDIKDRPTATECLDHAWLKQKPYGVKWPTEHLVTYVERRKFEIMKRNELVPT